MRPVERPVDHLAGVEVMDLGIVVEPGLVGHVGFAQLAQDQLFERRLAR